MEVEEKRVEEPRGPGLFQRGIMRAGAAVGAASSGFFGFWSPFRIVLVAILLIGAFTTYWSIQQRSLAKAALVASENWKQGLAALEKEEWITARDEFEKAARAVDLLKRRDPEAERIRQYYRETRVLTRISTVSLFDLLEDAADAVEEGGAEEWEQLFNARHRGSWMVVEGPVRAVTASAGETGEEPGGFELLFPWSPREDQAVRVRADFPVLERLVSGPVERQVIFGGELQECRLSEDSSHWTVRFRAATGFLWANEETYRSLGFTSDPLRTDEELQAHLRAQAKAMGVVP